MMTLLKFLKSLGTQEPLVAVQGNVLDTPADHIAFAIHYPNSIGERPPISGGFAFDVANKVWPELIHYVPKKGEVLSKRVFGKTYHAMAVHSNEINGWKESPQLIESCLNKLPVNSSEVIACVMIGGGNAGKKWKANVENISGMVNSYKTVVLYVYEPDMYNILLQCGIISMPFPTKGSLKTYRGYKEIDQAPQGVKLLLQES